MYVGIDVSKATLDVAVHPSGETWQIANETDAIAALVERFVAQPPELIVVEATGDTSGLWSLPAARPVCRSWS